MDRSVGHLILCKDNEESGINHCNSPIFDSFVAIFLPTKAQMSVLPANEGHSSFPTRRPKIPHETPPKSLTEYPLINLA